MGCPRVGNQAFTSYFDKIVPISYRVVNYKDIVPHLPMEAFGYYITKLVICLFF